ncbi:MAG TPA: hypothetical protein VKV21_16695 [Solirubrobacteraceae bacterium]|nr:hypothetical protein [Solirubrobacteraceae bacterium]
MRRVWRQSWPTIALVASIAIVVVLCLLASTTSGAALVGRHARAPGDASGQARTLVRRGTTVAVDPTAGRLYAALQRGTSARDTLERLDPERGRVLARRDLGGTFDAGVSFDGSLWVVSTSYTRRSSTLALWRLDPSSLAVDSRQELPGSRGALDVHQPLAGAGGRLWLAYGDRLVRIDPSAGTLGAPRHIARAQELGIAAAAGGRVLLLSAATDFGRGWIEERDPVTGAFERSSRTFLGVHQPGVGGTYAGRLWVAEATGMMGYVEAISVRTLQSLRTPAPRRLGTNGIDGRVVGGTLFVTDGGVTHPNYCGSPVTGAPRALLPAVVRHGGWVGAIARGRIYVVARAQRGASSGPLLSAPVPAGCR